MRSPRSRRPLPTRRGPTRRRPTRRGGDGAGGDGAGGDGGGEAADGDDGDEPDGNEPAHAIGTAAPVRGGSQWALIYVDGDTSTPWRTDSVDLIDGHIISVSRGPVGEAVDAVGGFRSTFRRPLLPTDEFRRRLATPPPPLRLLTVRDLVPPPQRAAYDQIVEAQRQGKPLRSFPPRPQFKPAEPPPFPKLNTSTMHDANTDTTQPPDWLHTGNGSGPRRINDPFGLPTDWNHQPPERQQHQHQAGGKADEEDCVLS